ncbi:hypothetical protein HPB47_023308 [Ixodes persulcatus]|uniref:Uncharacterized protein n=1 Tax=Ixodes persulcatus TaxID=34615 RepID=A0AC60QAJ8_IXOPE|nr:hypothetical protein HPB47_023308 [Ixodes persulcatus]
MEYSFIDPARLQSRPEEGTGLRADRADPDDPSWVTKSRLRDRKSRQQDRTYSRITSFDYEEDAARLEKIKTLHLPGLKLEVEAYLTRPAGTCRGIIHGIRQGLDNGTTQRRTRAGKTKVLGARRLGKSQSALVTFLGNRSQAEQKLEKEVQALMEENTRLRKEAGKTETSKQQAIPPPQTTLGDVYFKLIRELKEKIQQMQQQMQMFLTGMQTLESKSNKWLERLEMRNSQELKRRRPRGTTERLLELRVHNTFEELANAQIGVQIRRLGGTDSGRWLFDKLGLANPNAASLQQIELDDHIQTGVRTSRIWRNFNPSRDAERRMARSEALARTWDSRPGTLYVDAAGPVSGVATAADRWSFSKCLRDIRLARKRFPAPHKSLSKEGEHILRRLQTNTFLTPGKLHTWYPDRYALAACPWCGWKKADKYHMVWACENNEETSQCEASEEEWYAALASVKQQLLVRRAKAAQASGVLE